MGALICPVCRKPLVPGGAALRCPTGHSFDRAREGYVNLLLGSKPGDRTGDAREMALARRAFLEKGYYACLRRALEGYLAQQLPVDATALDICCGEGYYTGALAQNGAQVFAFDLSREMVRLAAKRREALCFVANLSAIPLADESVDAAIHLFAPFHDVEFSRILRPGGFLITVVPGRRHLFGMKEVLYEKPYENDEAPPLCPSLRIAETLRVSETLTLGREDIAAVLGMTPYGVHSLRERQQELLRLPQLTTQVEFVLYVLRKQPGASLDNARAND